MLWLGLVALVVVVIIFNRLVRLLSCAEGGTGSTFGSAPRGSRSQSCRDGEGYAGHEKDVLEKVTQSIAQAAQAASPENARAPKTPCPRALVNMLAVAEDYRTSRPARISGSAGGAVRFTEDQTQLRGATRTKRYAINISVPVLSDQYEEPVFSKGVAIIFSTIQSGDAKGGVINFGRTSEC